MASHDHVSLDFGQENNTSIGKTVRKPVAVFMHLGFRVLAILAYLFCDVISNSAFVSKFVVIVVLLSLDFWTSKNITGRLLAGLRWWNYVDEEGKSHWVFESRKGDAQMTGGAESHIFWLALVLSEAMWCILFFVALITFKFAWLMVAAVGVTLNGANLYGYVRCKMGSGTNIKNAATQYLGRQALASMFSGLTSSKTNRQQTSTTVNQ